MSNLDSKMCMMDFSHVTYAIDNSYTRLEDRIKDLEYEMSVYKKDNEILKRIIEEQNVVFNIQTPLIERESDNRLSKVED